MPVSEVLSYFKNVRTKMISRYHSLTDAELIKTSLHPRLKTNINPVDLAWFHAEHDDHHIVRINEILQALS